MTSTHDDLGRQVLPIPDQQFAGLITYDAKDPATSFPPIQPLRPPHGRAERPHRPHRRRRLRRGQPVRRSDRLPDGRAPRRRRAAVQPLPHDGAVLADAPGVADRPQPPRRRHGWDHRDRHVGTRLQLDPAEHGGTARRGAQAQRVLDGAVRQVPRGPGVGDEPDGTVHAVADGFRLRALLRVHRRGDEPVGAGDLPRHGAGRAGPDGGGGLPLHRGHDRSRHRLDPPAEGADARQAVLRLLRTRRRPMPRTTCRRSGPTSTRAASTPAGTTCARRRSPARRNWV